MDRRLFLQQTLFASISAALYPTNAEPHPFVGEVQKPKRLRAGQIVGLVSPASITYDPETKRIVEEILQVFGLKAKWGKYVWNRYGYLAGKDKERAEDLNAMFADPNVDMVLPLTGGWGCARVLPYLDYEMIRRNPKIILGFSDVTALHMAIYSKGNMVTFHGPNARSSWNEFAVSHIRNLMIEAKMPLLENELDKGDEMTVIQNRPRTITAGKAQGKLMGGNLTILTSLVGTPYLPDFTDAILFIEDIGEAIYRVDRMLTQLEQGGILSKVKGVVFGSCTDCDPDSGYTSFTLDEVLRDHLGSLGVPAFHGAQFGHIREPYTIPIGIQAEIDATRGTIQLLESAVL